MDYHFELLGDERFQKLCQSILVACFPDVTCLPVGQPDGGRDGELKTQETEDQSENIVFQVKFVKDPNTRDARDFIQEIIKSEGKKVSKLRSNGLKKYYLLTNVSGTSHYKSGSIDKVNNDLSENFDLEAHCWWRDDLERRIDTHTQIKWSFPEILKATDLLEQLIKNPNDPESKRKSDTLKSYMAHQARYDAQLKFKQIELQKGIIDLFVDTPARFVAPLIEEQQQSQDLLIELLANRDDENIFTDDELAQDEDEVEIFGALQLMVNPFFSKSIKCAVIEGAPGQGKSTITQYLCQVNRLVLLGRTLELKKLEKTHIPLEARIPFRIDLRDYASWISGKDPFSEDNGVLENTQQNPLLESFIAAQINRYTGTSFSVEDLISISKTSQLLIVLDGFDEIADIKLRNKIVSEVSDAAIRIGENALSSQIIVTSRPTAFANSPGFSRNEWQHIKMLPLSRQVIQTYAVKWLDGRTLEQREKEEILSVLEEKLEHSHVRDLARNPMQLAILLALISVQGASLPDKRTALYDNYINIFLNRESEKSKVVRDHRELLIQIHRYLAWVLQSEAEEKSQAGHIGEARLREVLRDFLEKSGHPTQLADELFSGMVERVVALVSRVQGTFEFEVQPLREYFAARFLYDTAPYSPAGSSHSGTLPERFDAIARNFYWLNVTRFYSGCYSYGELSSLIDGLEDLSEAEQFKYIGQPSRLGILLLRDYVFNQHPKLANRVITKIVSNLGFRALIGGAWTQRSDNDLAIPPGASRQILIDKCLSIIKSSNKNDEIYSASDVLNQNCSHDELYKIWEHLIQEKSARSTILQTGAAFGIFEKIKASETQKLISEFGERTLINIVRHQRLDIVDDNQTFIDIFINHAIHSGNGFLIPNKHTFSLSAQTILAYGLATLSSGYFLSHINEESSEALIHSILSSSTAFRGQVIALDSFLSKSLDEITDTDKNFTSAINIMAELYRTKLGDIKTEISKWDSLIETLRALWGDGSNLNSIAIEIANAHETAKPVVINLNDNHHSLISRTISAKQNINNKNWIKEQFTISEQNQNNSDLLIRSILKWCSIENIIEHTANISNLFDSLTSDQWSAIASSISYQTFINERNKINFSPLQIDSIPDGISHRFASILIELSNEESRIVLRERHLQNCNSDDTFVLESMVSTITNAAWSDPTYWPKALEAIKSAYNKGLLYSFDPAKIYSDDFRLPLEVAREICSNPEAYPMEIISTAESVLLEEIGQTVIPVGRIASDNQWFREA